MSGRLSPTDPAGEFIRWGGNVLLCGSAGAPIRYELDLLLRHVARDARQFRRPPNRRWCEGRLRDLAVLLSGLQPTELEVVAPPHRHVLIDVLRHGSTAASVVVVGQAIVALLRALIGERPVLLVVDELHLLDRATADVLALAVGSIGTSRGFQVVAAEEVPGGERPWGKRLLPAPQMILRVDGVRHHAFVVTL